MSNPGFFGYGSLVNLATHDYLDPRPAMLQGWRRVWQRTNLREAAFLSIVPDPDVAIHGVIARVPGADWTALDQREAAYERHDVSAAVGNSHTAIYQVNPIHLVRDGKHPILLSYLDVVVQGYLACFGPDGVRDFFATTTGWDASVLDDRHAPRYARHQTLSPAEQALVDQHLAAVMQQAE